MMPDLGKYAFDVLASYGATITLLLALVGATLWRGRRLRAEMKEMEQRSGRNG
ncbi:heme exporter protein CcmD [Phaeobacter sp.]|uniref:heme exporter protein CcmD n=1 Tax=Phaeobacter sp. TaxID=1902409 RepID=UPI0025E36766|nr:heme exporter protein CcmD [Phaeobacter sp.]